MMKPTDTGHTGHTGHTLPHPGSSPSDRRAAPHQLDLFTERGRMPPRPVPKPMPPTTPAMETLTDDELLELVPEARPLNVEALCSQLVDRSLEAAVPGLEALWRRFTGFGIEQPLREQLAVLDTLARLGGADARKALRRIVLSRALPASLLPAALQGAAGCGLALPAGFVGPLLDHGDATVRGAAFALADKANVPADQLRKGLFDRSAPNRRLVMIALGLRGDPEARQPLLGELARSPSAEVIEAIAAVWNDDAIVHLGRCARRHPQLTSAVVDALRDIGTPLANTVTSRLESATGISTPTDE